MARPIKIGLDYFPMDTTWDIKMRLLKARYKLEGVGLIVELYQAIYREGYALIWNEDSRILIADETGISIERLDEIVGFAAAKDIFDSRILGKGYLTSHGIQARWVKACTDTKRKENKIPTDIDLLQHDNEFTPEETHVKPEETKSNAEFSTQIKVKEIKEKEIKRDNIAPQAATLKHFEVTVPEKTDPLYNEIKTAFEKVNGNFTNYGKEGKAIKLIIKMTKGDRNAIHVMIRTFFTLRQRNDKYWSSMPFTPSRLAASGVWDSVKEEAKKTLAATDTSWIDAMVKEEVAV